MSHVGYDNPGEATQPSPSIWGDCPNTILNDKGLGVFVREDFQSPLAITTTVDSAPVASGAFSYKGDTDTSITSVADTPSGIVEIETDTTAADAGCLVANAFAKIVKNSGNQVWFEARVAPGDVDDDLGTFIGFVEEDGADEDVIADDPATNASTANVTLVGFFQNNANPDAYNAIYKNDTGTAVEVLSDVTNATGLPSADRASLIDGVGATGAGFHKLGIRFDGRDKLQFYVDGYKVAEQTVDSTVDQTNYLAPIVAVKTGDTAAEKIFVDWVQAAYQTRH
jgi:hypothetical protein